MAERFFLDTNIFVYSFDRSEPEKQRGAQSLIEKCLDAQCGVISYQVVQEFLNVALRRFRKTVPFSDVRVYLSRILMPMCEIYPDGRLFAEAITIAEETGWSFYDSIIVASAVSAGCDILWSEDLQDGRMIRGIEVRNPF
jgi:predicted nucleic acid-binding protein